MTVKGVFRKLCSTGMLMLRRKKSKLIFCPQTYNNKVNIIVPTAYWCSAYVTWFYCVQYLQFYNFQNSLNKSCIQNLPSDNKFSRIGFVSSANAYSFL